MAVHDGTRGDGDGNGRGRIPARISGIADNRPARIYLAVCAALVLWVALDAAFVPHEDASLAGVWPVAATAPTSLLALAVPLPDGPVGAALLLGLVSLAAVVNAGVLSAVLRRFRTRAARA
ncbi:SCO4225 family membrane protein [Streptomyces fenghuangensis]|uniref:SCO4225 family membrane protein n=1 Tax=Streptomyces sp. ICN903 TaxID=2964654 RepID=UPI001EDBF2BB|nr:hypothetical protein [Streptomyces sp. ICN903]MCG3043770.1 hypothetical protein [Streptomyces sp. ICN903]